MKIYDSLAITHPNLIQYWHPTKNGSLKPTDVTSNASQKVWWYLPYDDPKTGRHFDFEWEAVISNRNGGAGCPYINVSRTERILFDLLCNNQIDYCSEKTFTECKFKNPLPFDFYIIKQKLLIECDGIQHFRVIDYFGGYQGLRERKKNDNIKNDFCKNQNIPLLRIPYVYDPVADKDKIENFVLDFIQTKKVPKEIKDFYAKHSFSNYCK